MAPSEIPIDPNGVGEEKPGANKKDVKESTTQHENNVEKTAVSKTSTDSKAPQKAAEVTNSSKLSNAELKQRAKAEKAARRVQGKQNQEPKTDKALQAKGKAEKDKIRRGSEAGGAAKFVTKAQNKSAVSGEKPLPVRSAQPSAPTPGREPKKENKDVALFGHLYGHPRRTTIAGASKDVHPTVLALGLQMSNYVVCGSSARCVATLLVFKRVRYMDLN